jgi:type IV secretion system protein VirB6
MISTIDQLIQNVDHIILLFVQSAFGSFSDAIAMFWRMMFILFIALFGYKIIISGRFSAPELFTHILKIVLILIIATQWDAFFLLVYNMATDLPSDIAGQLIRSASTSLNTGAIDSAQSANLGLSAFYDRSMAVTEDVLEGAGWNDIGIYLYAGAIAVTALLFSGYAAMLIILAKIAVAILLGVGPIFILLLMFKNTQSLFEGWLRTLISFALIPIFIYAVIAFFLILAESPLQNLEENAGVNNELLSAMAPFLLISIVGFMIMTQVMNMAASITGGLSLSSMGAATWTSRKATSISRRAPAALSKGSVLVHAGMRHPKEFIGAARAKMGDAIRQTRGF